MTTPEFQLAKRPRVPTWLFMILCAVGILLALVGMPLLLRAHLLEAFHIPAASMSPGLLPGDHMFVLKLATKPSRGQVVVFRYPLDPEISYVKRVVGLAGDTVEVRAGRLLINGVAADVRATDEACEPGAAKEVMQGCQVAIEELDGRAYRIMLEPRGAPHDHAHQRIPPGFLFVLGDNRDNSNDSRVWGLVPEQNVLGRALFIHWSWTDAGPRWDRIGTAVR